MHLKRLPSPPRGWFAAGTPHNGGPASLVYPATTFATASGDCTTSAS